MKLSCATHIVILSAPGKGKELRERFQKWLTARGLSRNEEKTRLVNSREGFNFLGFTVRWQSGRVNKARWYPSSKSRQRLWQTVRQILNHWTQWKSIAQVVEELNPVLRGWSGYYHFRHSIRVMRGMQGWGRARFKGWLWRKQGRSKGKWAGYPDTVLHERHGLWLMPIQAPWKRT